MSVLTIPQSIRTGMESVSQIAETMSISQLFKVSIFYLIGKYDEANIKAKARESQIPLTTFMDAVDCLSWIVCEAVKNNCSADKFREFIAEFEFLNTNEVLELYENAFDTVHQCLQQVAPETDHFISLDWRVQVEFARRSLRQFKRPFVVMDLKTNGGKYTLESTPAMLCQIHDDLEAALNSCRTAQFRRIQRFVK